MDKVSIGIPVYGAQEPKWWQRILLCATQWGRQDIDIRGIHTAASMLTDSNRNEIAADFLKTDSEWLYWIDADNPPPAFGLRRLLDAKKDLITGLYFLKNNEAIAVAYMLDPETHRYSPIKGFNRGEILPIDMAGMGACLMHRSVLETIKSNYVPLQTYDGGIIPVHKDDIKDALPDALKSKPKVYDGKLHLPICKPTIELKAFPWFVLMHTRTEDLIFFEMAKRCGIQLWLDTSVISGDVGPKEWNWDDHISYEMLEEDRKPSQLTVEVTRVSP